VPTWRFYNSRAECENRIKQLKDDFGAGGFCLHSFDGTEAALYIGVRVCREEENWVRQLEAARAERGRAEAGCDAPTHSEQNPNGRWSR
jgi:hypothetical protein